MPTITTKFDIGDFLKMTDDRNIAGKVLSINVNDHHHSQIKYVVMTPRGNEFTIPEDNAHKLSVTEYVEHCGTVYNTVDGEEDKEYCLSIATSAAFTRIVNEETGSDEMKEIARVFRHYFHGVNC